MIRPAPAAKLSLLMRRDDLGSGRVPFGVEAAAEYGRAGPTRRDHVQHAGLLAAAVMRLCVGLYLRQGNLKWLPVQGIRAVLSDGLQPWLRR